MTFVATFEAVTQAGGVPVLVDVSRRRLRPRPGRGGGRGDRRRGRASSLPVHLYGQMADMHALGDLAARHGLGHRGRLPGARSRAGRPCAPARCGNAAAFSFYPGKNLGAMGDAGALVTTDDGELADASRALREHGQRQKYEHEREGYTARLDTIQAASCCASSPLLDGWNARTAATPPLSTWRRSTASATSAASPVAAGSDPVWHLFVVRTADPPDSLGAFCAERGIRTGRHYPEPLHLSQAYAHARATSGASFPVAEAIAARVPVAADLPGIDREAVEHVVESVRE